MVVAMDRIRLRMLGSLVMFIAWLALISNYAVLFTVEGFIPTLLQVGLVLVGTGLLYVSWAPKVDGNQP
ncbi:hypothetical protein GCM10010525_12480 [Glutamicibacter bergerei]|jgi:uncharacterized PurR-regulated membrane protein YhhQ (DUF165 family)|uniref:Uncharacterized protein n=2 Tax=Glutamicibacter TaxID=1742989 RepID=A0ABQ2DPY0_9MICC|nr:hypothetical protein CIK74_04410 [Glutamicibacter sp. BW77]GGJ63667.1 hypothetical protein GCM10007173_23250 [Glutamicibacter ardleyensis]HBV10891.1 hypothetical protein [Micrococcaceae bacterium]